MIRPHIPHRFEEAIGDYIDKGVPVGGFLTAVLENNLKEAFGRADENSVLELPGIVSWLYNHAPAACWGSPERVDAWMRQRQEDADKA